MSSRHGVLALLLSCTGCDIDPAILVELEGKATMPIDLAPPPEPISARQGTVRWVTVDAPSGSAVPQPEPDRIEDGKIATFQPDLRGTYIIERWLTYGIGEDLTHRFVIDVSGANPRASSTTETPEVQLQQVATIVGTASDSPEHLPLTYHWRLRERPSESVATVIAEGPQTMLAPDVAGSYLVELSVFDGELWSENPALVLISASD